MKWPIVGLLLLASCSHGSEEPLDQKVLTVSIAGWREQKLPEPSLGCYEGFRIQWAKGAEDFAADCTGATLTNAASCLHVDKNILGPWHARADYEPVAVLRPGQAIDAGGDPAVHEFMHLAIYCAGLWPRDDPYDYHHQDRRVWAQWGEMTAQAKARRIYRDGK